MILIGLLLKSENDHATNGVMTQQEVKCTPNNQCKCTVLNEKQGMLLHEMTMQSFLYENMTTIFQANLVQVPCKMQNAMMHNDAKK